MAEKIETYSRLPRRRKLLIVAHDIRPDAQIEVAEAKPELITIKSFCRMCSIGRTSAYKILKSQKIRAVRIGSRTLVVRADVDALMAQSIVDWRK